MSNSGKKHVTLEKAHKDIHKYTELKYEWEPIKKGCAVVSVRFVFSKKRMIEHQKEQKKAENKKQATSNNKLFFEVRDCRKQKGLKSGAICTNPTCAAKK